MKIRQFLAATCVATGLAGCTTIVNHMVDNINHAIGINSVKKGHTGRAGDGSAVADVTVVEHQEKLVFGGAPPAVIVLNDNARQGRKVVDYTLKISMRGFYPEKIVLKKTADGWHCSNYLGLGKVIGWLVLNPGNGGIYTLTPKQLLAAPSEGGHGDKPDGNRIDIVTVHRVPNALKGKMTLVGYLSPKKSKGVPNGRK